MFLIGSLAALHGESFSDESHTNSLSLIDLPTALRLAGARNLDVQIARQRLDEAKANSESALWQFFPWISPGLGYRRHDNLIQDVEGNMVEVHKDSYQVGPSLSSRLDLGDAIYKSLASRQLVKAADFALAAQSQDAILAAAEEYFELARAHGAVDVAKEAVGISSNYAAQVQEAVGAGIAFKGDLLRVQVQTERNRLTARQAQEQQRIAGARLAQTLRLDPIVELISSGSGIAPVSLVDTNATLDSLLAQALRSRPELRQSRAYVEASQKAKQGATYGPLIPFLGAEVFAGGLGGGKNGTSGTFGESEDYQFSVGWRIGPGGLFDQGRIHATEARLKIAELNEKKLMDELSRQVIEALTRVQSQADQMSIARRAIQAADETLRLTRERKQFGVGVVLEAIQAEQDLTRARLDYLNAVAEFNKAQFGLNKAIGKIGADKLAGRDSTLE
jgi:outer membrane protein TolC